MGNPRRGSSPNFSTGSWPIDNIGRVRSTAPMHRIIRLWRIGRPVPDLSEAPLGEVGMSEACSVPFSRGLTQARQRELAALRCPDRYFLELRMDDGSYRRLDELSGGQRVSVLLSLLLETEDSRPLVIDQPEDELDNRFLFETVLPALKKMKGRRQVIVAYP